MRSSKDEMIYSEDKIFTASKGMHKSHLMSDTVRSVILDSLI